MSDKRARFAQLLKKNGIIVAPGVYDCIGVTLVERVGFEAVYITGFGTSAGLIGKPDLGFLTLTEALSQAERIDKTTRLPVLADAEAGFGNAVTTVRTVREYEKAGIAAIHLEDQINPIRWKPDGYPQVVSAEEHADKIRAAVEARQDSNFFIIGRTDAARRFGLAEAIRRANIYVKAGADFHFVHGLDNMEDLKRVAMEVDAPGLVNYSTILESGNEPVPVSRLEEMGYKLVIFPTELLFSASKTMKDLLLQLKETGNIDGWKERRMPLEEFKELFGWSEYNRVGEEWLPNIEKGRD